MTTYLEKEHSIAYIYISYTFPTTHFMIFIIMYAYHLGV